MSTGESKSFADRIRDSPELLGIGELQPAKGIKVVGVDLVFRDEHTRLHLVSIVDGTADETTLRVLAAAPTILHDRLGEEEVFVPRAHLVARDISTVVEDQALELKVRCHQFPVPKPRDGASVSSATRRPRPKPNGSALRLPSYQELSKEQDRINNLALDGRFLVIGPPGTGKTVMALYRASMLKRRRRSARLLMYSRLLTQYTANAIAQLGLDGTVQTYHAWFYHFYLTRYHKKPPETAPYHHDYAEVLKVIAADPPHLDASTDLLVDEGQDLPKEFYAVSRLLAKNAVIFADENQRITDFNSTMKEIQTFGGLEDPLRLTRNYRNTQEIAKVAGHFYTGLRSGVPDLPERRGEIPVMRRFQSIENAAESIRVFEKNNPGLAIGVFTPTKKLQARFVDLLEDRTENPVQFYEGGLGAKAVPLDFTQAGIMVVNYPSVKGLEFDAVFMPEIQDIAGETTGPDIRMQMYVLISRARQHLQISYSGSDSPQILDLFPLDLLELR